MHDRPSRPCPPSSPARRARAACAVLAAAGVLAVAGPPGNASAQSGARYDIVGGDTFYTEGGTKRCAIGFAITRGAEQGFVTSSSCGGPGTKTYGPDGAEQGVIQASSFPTAVVITNPDWNATPYVRGLGGQLMPVAGSAPAPVGSSVCRSGPTTGWQCGRITRLNVSISFPEGTVHGLTETTACAEPGESGGPFVSGDQAQGILFGGSGNCSSGGTTYFHPIRPILQAYGVTLKTTGGT
ncbi:hypothetical protein GCM10010252_73620 [Streptomyces aureoverticillatus]|nr:hypothetical protein GCM10010252_73620 [Streptomyces aureoverticillatus]